ncbi:MAG: hypothetical protein QM478_08345 [Flavobacteriaceae bacterium]
MKSDKENIDKFIALERRDNLWNHIITTFSYRRPEVIAEKQENQYILWSWSHWVGTFYLVYIISFDEENNIIKVRTKLNVIAKIFGIAVILLWLFLLRFVIINLIENLNINSALVIIIFFVFTTISYVLLIKIYRLERKEMLKHLKFLRE